MDQSLALCLDRALRAPVMEQLENPGLAHVPVRSILLVATACCCWGSRSSCCCPTPRPSVRWPGGPGCGLYLD